MVMPNVKTYATAISACEEFVQLERALALLHEQPEHGQNYVLVKVANLFCQWQLWDTEVDYNMHRAPYHSVLRWM